MEKYLQIIKESNLFEGVGEVDIENMLGCLGANEQRFGKNQFIINTGDLVKSIGLLLVGEALIVQEDFWGNTNILRKIVPSEIFAETFACNPRICSNVTVVAKQKCVVLWLNVNQIMTTCSSNCEHHNIIIKNLLFDFAGKNLNLSNKITHMGQRTTRNKVLSFLSSQAQIQDKKEFDIEFNRQQLADYLSVERSALSAELSKLRNEDIINFEKNHFILKKGKV